MLKIYSVRKEKVLVSVSVAKVLIHSYRDSCQIDGTKPTNSKGRVATYKTITTKKLKIILHKEVKTKIY